MTWDPDGLVTTERFREYVATLREKWPARGEHDSPDEQTLASDGDEPASQSSTTV